MKAALGILALAFGASASVVGVFSLAAGLRRHDTRALEFGRRCVYGVLIGGIGAVAAMEWALLSHDFSLQYVAENNARGTPLLFTITGLWAALEGSILLWILILGGYLGFMARKFRRRVEDPMVGWALLVAMCVSLFFFALVLGPANPFKLVKGGAPFDGAGPNPLLQDHPLMAFHPPMLYLGYVGFTVPFAFAIAALITGRFSEGWLAETRRATLVAWMFLTIGIILGAWWSYEVLGWGGYWAWDPVENASLLPWLTGTAFIHSVMIQERRGMLRVWNLSLVVATFCLTILGTFLTRSGIITSVHSFTISSIGPWLLVFLGVVMAVGVALIAWRADRLHSPGRIDSPVSREAAFLGNNLLFAGLAFVVLLGTVFPLIAEAFRGTQFSVGQPYFDRMTEPLGLLLLLLMAVAPALPWRATTGEVVRRRLLVPAYIGVVVAGLTVLAGSQGLATPIGFGLGAFAVSAIVRNVAAGVRARSRADHVGPVAALVRTVRGNPRHYGGLVVHTGVVLIAIALASASSFGSKSQVRLDQGTSRKVDGYTLTYLGAAAHNTSQKNTVSARIKVQQGGRTLGVYAPAVSSFPNSMEAIGTPSVHTGLREDLYLTLVSSPNERGRVTVGVLVNPMVLWLWIGGLVMAMGTLIALSPAVRDRARRARREPRDATPAVGGTDDGDGVGAQGGVIVGAPSDVGAAEPPPAPVPV